MLAYGAPLCCGVAWPRFCGCPSGQRVCVLEDAATAVAGAALGGELRVGRLGVAAGGRGGGAVVSLPIFHRHELWRSILQVVPLMQMPICAHPDKASQPTSKKDQSATQ